MQLINKARFYLQLSAIVLLFNGMVLTSSIYAQINKPPIYINIVIHTEAPPDSPNFEIDTTSFWEYRQRLIEFANMLSKNTVMINYQTEWNFAKAVALYDDGTPDTHGKNVFRYLREDLGFEIDPHSHETTFHSVDYNYADVVHLIQLTGVTPSRVAGGFIAAPPQDSQLEQFWNQIVGCAYSASTWQANILWGAATYLHTNETCLWASGIWKPKDAYHFLVHDSTAPIPNIGTYGSSDTTDQHWHNFMRLVQLQRDGLLPLGKIYTCTIFVPHTDLNITEYITEFEQRLHQYLPDTSLHWVGLQQVINIWKTEYNSEPNIYVYEPPTGINDRLWMLY
ncbi:MAG: hypothetical protein ACE14V_16160 [bacterium]